MLKIEVIFLETSFATVSVETSKGDWICTCGCKLFAVKQTKEGIGIACSACNKINIVYLKTRKLTKLELVHSLKE